MNKTVHARKIDTVFALLIFCVFAGSVLVVLTFSGSAYKNVAETSREGSDERTCLSYVWTSAKRADENGSVYVTEFNGIPSLYMEEEFWGFIFYTIIYYYDGWVYEIYAEEGYSFNPEDGTKVMKSEPLTFEQSGNLIKAMSGESTVFISPRSGVTGDK